MVALHAACPPALLLFVDVSDPDIKPNLAWRGAHFSDLLCICPSQQSLDIENSDMLVFPQRLALDYQSSLWFGCVVFTSLFEDAICRLESLGGKRVEMDFSPFLKIASLLYGGAFVAERLSGIREFLQKSNDQPFSADDIKNDKRLNSVVRAIFSGGGEAFHSTLKLDAVRYNAHSL